jgi:hypothetical protein
LPQSLKWSWRKRRTLMPKSFSKLSSKLRCLSTLYNKCEFNFYFFLPLFVESDAGHQKGYREEVQQANTEAAVHRETSEMYRLVCTF